MGCGCSKAAVGVATDEQAAAGRPPAGQAQQSADSVPAALKNRAARDGMWFVVHRRMLDSVEREEVCEMATEFWSHHPHGDKPGLDEFVAIKLSLAMIERQRPLIYLSSYRWQDILGFEGGRECATPGNFMWFLELCKQRGWIGWMDFMANVVVNVPAATTVGYMGLLYATSTVAPQGLYEPTALGAAMTRAWVFQETAFGALESSGVDALLAHVRVLGERVRNGDVECLCGELMEVGTALATLLVRRGWRAFLERREAQLMSATEHAGEACKGYVLNVIADVLVQRVSGSSSAEVLRDVHLILEQRLYPRNWHLYQ